MRRFFHSIHVSVLQRISAIAPAAIAAPFLAALSMAPQTAHAAPILCVEPHIAHPSTNDPNVQGILQWIQTIATEPRMTSIPARAGYDYEFCWIEKEGQFHPVLQGGVGTSFWRVTTNTGRKHAGILYSIDILNQAIQLSHSAEAALYPALFILYHEIAHAVAGIGSETGDLANSVRNRDAFFWMNPLADEFQGIEKSLFEAISARTSGSEAFADCYGAYLMTVELRRLWSRNPTFLERVERMLRDRDGIASTMNVSAAISSNLIGQDEHGTMAERQSFVRYGLDAADHYIGYLDTPTASRALNSVLLACANMAWDHQWAKSAFRMRTGLNAEFPAPVFDRNRGW